jgi:large subunit ribosomal protein L13
MTTVKTWSPKASDAAAGKKWYVVDAEGQTLGRLATEIARILRGKHKPTFAPHMDMGDNVIVINAAKIAVTGKRAIQKNYYRHSGYPGGFRVIPYQEMLAKHPTRILERAVRGMLPKHALGADLFRNLKVYAGPTHPHAAQQPEELKIVARVGE